jgi:hypothetical protein
MALLLFVLLLHYFPHHTPLVKDAGGGEDFSDATHGGKDKGGDLSTWCCRLEYGTNTASWGTSNPWNGFSIRCVKG